MKKAIAFLAATLIFTGCAANPETGNYEVSRTGIGLGIGAVGGALVGAAMGDGGTAIKGAILGAAAGGAGGHYWDKQFNSVQNRLADSNLGVERRVNTDGQSVLVVTAAADAHFKVGSAYMSHESFAAINALANELKKTPYRINITGHTDSTGPDQLNERLSYERARAVAAYLVAAGVPGKQLFVRGVGSRSPKADNDTISGRAANRRVEIELAQAS